MNMPVRPHPDIRCRIYDHRCHAAVVAADTTIARAHAIAAGIESTILSTLRDVGLKVAHGYLLLFESPDEGV
jgi:hypothetical protein